MPDTVEDHHPWPPIAEVRQYLRANRNILAADTQICLRRTGALAAVAIFWDGEVLLSYIDPQEPREERLAKMLA